MLRAARFTGVPVGRAAVRVARRVSSVPSRVSERLTTTPAEVGDGGALRGAKEEETSPPQARYLLYRCDSGLLHR